MEIYIDILILQNVVMNYLILFMTSKLSKTRISNLRLLLGSLVGASYVVFLLLFPEMKIYYTTVAKILLSLFIVAVTFYPPEFKSFMRI
ncbi:MAG TPA: sigma-E processing peptidase SpoIIGA, partial [Ruminiclostridium sp.]|nr:sigma-E processing peptidase SpoIIGA [Ruminiclostridium sp.]